MPKLDTYVEIYLRKAERAKAKFPHQEDFWFQCEPDMHLCFTLDSRVGAWVMRAYEPPDFQNALIERNMNQCSVPLPGD